MPLALLDAYVDGNESRARELVDYSVPDEFPGAAAEVLELRRIQLAADPTRLPWSVRAIVRRDDRLMIGFVNFHGPPGVNDIEASDAAELGWTVFSEHRRHGYATLQQLLTVRYRCVVHHTSVHCACKPRPRRCC